MAKAAILKLHQHYILYIHHTGYSCSLKHTNRLTWDRWVEQCTSVRRTMLIIFIAITKYASFATQKKWDNVNNEVSHKANIRRH